MAKILRFTFTIVTLLFAISINSKAQKMSIRLADDHFKNYDFQKAIDYYQYYYGKDSTNNYVIRQIAICCSNIGKTEDTEKWLRKLVHRTTAEPDDFYKFALSLKSNGKYTEAEQYMRKYAELKPNDSRVMMEVSMLEYIQFLMRDSARYVIRNLPTNTKGSDMGPCYMKDKLVFSSTSLSKVTNQPIYSWNELPYLDMYEAKILENGNLSSPVLFAPKIRTNYHDGPISYDEKNNTLYVTRNNKKRGKALKGEGKELNLETFIGKMGKDGWEVAENFQFNSEKYSVGHPAIDTTGNVLYFASDMPGGYGGTDIYFSIHQNGKWSTPYNLGPKINSSENELFPYISKEGILYFASAGHGGLGGLDIFFSVPENGVYNTVENMGYPVNSSKDDFGICFDTSGLKGYFTSNRSGGKGDDDLYYFQMASVPVILRGTVKDRITDASIANAKVVLINEKGDTINSLLSRTNGAFEFDLEKGHKYSVQASKEQHTPDLQQVSTIGAHPNEEIKVELFLFAEKELTPETPVVQKAPVATPAPVIVTPPPAETKPAPVIAQEVPTPKKEEPVVVPQSIKQTATPAPTTQKEYGEPLKMEEENGQPLQVLELEYINYDLDQWNIRKDAADILDRLVAIMLEYPDLEIRLESHTDSRGSDDYNLLLSKKRARSAFEYVVSKGIDPMRMQYDGYGETRLLNHCANGVECSEEEHEVNRRTIVKVVRKGPYKSTRKNKNVFIF